MNSYINQVEYNYKKSLRKTLKLLEVNSYIDADSGYRTGVLERMVQDTPCIVNDAVRPDKAEKYIRCIDIIYQLRQLEIKRFVIGVIGNTKSGKSTLLSKIGCPTKPSASIHTTELGYYNLAGITFIDFPGDDDVNDEIKNEFMYNFRTVDMCIMVTELNKVTTDGVFNLINKVKVNYDVPYLVLLNKSDSVIYANDDDQDDLSLEQFNQFIGEKTIKIQEHFLKNRIASVDVYTTCLITKRVDLELMKQYGVLLPKDVFGKVIEMIENDDVVFNKDLLQSHMI